MDSFLLITRHRLPITDYPSPITDHRSPITDHRSPITHHRSPVTDYPSPKKLFSIFAKNKTALNTLTNPATNTKLLLAPFQGITDKIYRNCYAKYFGGIDVMYTPFVSGLGNTKINPSKLKDLLPKNSNISDTVPQIISTDPKEIILFSKAMQDNGYDHINWNLGCPFSRIANKKRGCGILPYPDELTSILDNIYKEDTVQISIKTRLGYYKNDEIFNVLKILDEYPLKNIVLHPRTGLQLYSGEADPELYKKCLQFTKHEMIYNGDIYNHSQFKKMQQYIPTQQSWMLGRGALLNPFLAMEIKGVKLSNKEKKKELTAFHDNFFNVLIYNYTNNAKIIGRLKAVWKYMSGVFYDGENVFNIIKKSKSLEEYSASVKIAFETDLADDAGHSEYYNKFLKHIGSLAEE